MRLTTVGRLLWAGGCLLSCVDGGLWHPSKQDRISESDEREKAVEDEDNSSTTCDIFEELD